MGLSSETPARRVLAQSRTLPLTAITRSEENMDPRPGGGLAPSRTASRGTSPSSPGTSPQPSAWRTPQTRRRYHSPTGEPPHPSVSVRLTTCLSSVCSTWRRKASCPGPSAPPTWRRTQWSPPHMSTSRCRCITQGFPTVEDLGSMESWGASNPCGPSWARTNRSTWTEVSNETRALR